MKHVEKKLMVGLLVRTTYKETGCSEYGDLVNYSVSEKFDDWFPTVRSQTIFLTAYLRSNRHKPKNVNKETGEIK